MRVCLFVVMLCIARSLILDADQEYHFHHLEAKFGTPYENRTYSGLIGLSEPLDACTEVTVNLTGRIGLAIRDKTQKSCSFTRKVFNLQQAGVIGVVIMNQKPLRWEEETLIRMGESPSESFNITIPSVFISYADGLIIQSKAGSNATLTISSVGENRITISLWYYGLSFLILLVITYSSFILIGVFLGVYDYRLKQSLLRMPSSLQVEVFDPSKVKADAENPVECSICLDTVEKGEEVKRLPCGHVFHAVCIDPWLNEQRAVCPVCRQGIYDDEELNWNMEEKFRDTDRFVFRWERVYGGSMTYVYSVCFFVFVLLSPIVYSFLL
ncbi:hypothetical protein WA577_003795, partial [Blastocystis sp. JDR]